MGHVTKMESTHKVIDFLDHLWPYLAGVFAVVVGGFKLWWSDRKEKEHRISNIERILERLDDQVALKTDLITCREEVRSVDEKNLDLIFAEIKSIHTRVDQEASDNAAQHQEILGVVVDAVAKR